MKFSIITPYFKCFKLMDKYFECLEKQEYKNFEVILIDDASNDGCIGKIDEQLTKREIAHTIKINSRNSGPGISRNIGIDIASGDFLFFLDADDWIAEDTLSRIKSVVEESPDVECVAFDYYKVSNDGKKKPYSIIDGDFDHEKIIRKINTSCMGKAYSASFINDKKIRFFPGYLAEDFYFTIAAMSECNTIRYLKNNLYFYREANTSITHNVNIEQLNGIKRIIEELHRTGFIDFDDRKYFLLREYIYTGIKRLQGKSNRDIYTCLKSYTYRELMMFLGNMRKYQRIIVLLYRFHMNCFIGFGLRVLE